jgi:hypothetical protein
MNAKRLLGRRPDSTRLGKWLLLALAGGFLFLQEVPSGPYFPATFEQSLGPRVAGAAVGDSSLTVNSLQILMKYDYIEVDGAMSGRVIRSDGSQGTYKVPIKIVYPAQAKRCNGTAIVDVVNSVFYETFAQAGTSSDPFFPSLFPFARLLLGDDFMFGAQYGGYIYAQVQWNKLVIERQRAAGTLEDDTLHISQGTDGYQIIADMSRLLRNPPQAVKLAPSKSPCRAADVIAFGYSQTGQLLRTFYLHGLNTSLATDPVFDNRLVFEGAIQAVGGGSCRYLTDNSAESWYSYSMTGCIGATPANAGRVFTINAETDVEILGGWQARGQPQDAGRYRTYEIAGAAHIPSPLFDLKLLGLKPLDAPVQNYADTAPVFRAMMRNLNAWIKEGVDPPESATIAGHIGSLRKPLFSERSWGNHDRQVFIADVGADGNALGGIRLVHVRTTDSAIGAIGGPLGISRGTECFNDVSNPDYLLGCEDSSFYSDMGDAAIYALNGGTFKPYTELRPGLCAGFYPDYAAYVTAVTVAAQRAAKQRWILPEEVGPLVVEAQAKAGQFAGCVPSSQP